MQEIFKDVNESYEVSNLGRVFRKRSVIKAHSKGTFRIIERSEKKASDNGKGYLFMCLYENNIQKRVYVHRLVAEAFLDNPDNKPQVNHKDGNKANNNVENLEWVTSGENNNHALLIGLRTEYPGKRIAAYLDGKEMAVFKNAVVASKMTGICRASIAECAKPFREGQGHTAGGFKWKYI